MTSARTKMFGVWVPTWVWMMTPWLRRCWWAGHEWRGPMGTLPEQVDGLDRIIITYRPCKHCGGAYAAARYPATKAWVPTKDFERMMAEMHKAGLPIQRRFAP